jgi:hypothetical protein
MSRSPGSQAIAFATWLLALLGTGLMYASFGRGYQLKLISLALCGASKEGDDQPAC